MSSASRAPAFAVLFDWDGVVVDSSAHHERSWVILAGEENLTLKPGFFRDSFGQINRWLIPNQFGWSKDPAEIQRLGARKEEIYRELVAAEGLQPLPGVRELLEALAAAGIPRVIGTSTERENIRTALEAMDLRRAFSGVVASEDVREGKPGPEVYQKAARLAGVEPERCVVIEDTFHGLEAASRAGARRVAFTTTYPRERFADYPVDLLVPDASHLSVERLAGLFRGPSR